MATDAELGRALDAGAGFVPAVLNVEYDVSTDRVLFVTPWGERSVLRTEIGYFEHIIPAMMQNIYASTTGIHIDEADLDINSAGLIGELFPELRGRLINSY